MPKRSSSRRKYLRSQRIDESGPGSVLVDFEALLGFVEDGARSTGRYHLLPQARLFELDERLARPLRPRLKRPQQRSFPHINGLYLLLRATQLGVPEGHGKTSGRLVLDASMHRQWLQLNPTERYFTLLEAWLGRGDWEMIGLRGGGWMNTVAVSAHNLWMSVPAAGRRPSKKERSDRSFPRDAERSCTLALLELFGLMEVEREEPEQGQNWCVTEVRHTAFGDELLQVVFGEVKRELANDEMGTLEFGAWQPVLQPFFPEWVNNLEIPNLVPRDGVFYFKVSLGRPWRRIAIPAKSDLEELAKCIIEAFDFDGDHLHGFQLVARDGRRVRIEHPYIDDAETHTDEVSVGELPLMEHQSMEFVYDYGAEWRFDVKLEKIDPDQREFSSAAIVESRGEAPPEYEFYDDEW